DGFAGMFTPAILHPMPPEIGRDGSHGQGEVRVEIIDTGFVSAGFTHGNQASLGIDEDRAAVRLCLTRLSFEVLAAVRGLAARVDENGSKAFQYRAKQWLFRQ